MALPTQRCGALLLSGSVGCSAQEEYTAEQVRGGVRWVAPEGWVKVRPTDGSLVLSYWLCAACAEAR